MKRLSVFLFLMMIALCGLYGYSFFVFEKNHSEFSENQNDSVAKDAREFEQDPEEALEESANVLDSDETTDAAKEAVTTNVVEGAYLLKIEQNELRVYQVSDDSVYMTLDLDSLRLNNEVQKEFEVGVYAKDEQMLYSMLESISS